MKGSTMTAALLIGTLTACATTPASHPAERTVTPLSVSSQDLGREVLAPNDGWASATTGTTGGSDATPENVHTVTNRRELLAALAGGSSTPKIIYVNGMIDANVDDQNNPLTCQDYATNGYSLDAYLAAYDPATWGRQKPAGALEAARRASQLKQAERVRIRVGSNTTIVGVGANSGFTGANLVLDRVDNVILRNLNFHDAHDCFPTWDPTDGSHGNWNSEYDTVSLTTATHVWVDRSAFSDGNNPDSQQPLYFGRPYQVHDGSLDITRGSDLVTISWNIFKNHDKTMLIGSTDNRNTGLPHSDVDRLRVTVHHNLFQDNLQRLPRVRFGQVHIYNNAYQVTDTQNFSYALGVGFESQIYAENNHFDGPAITADRILKSWKGRNIHITGTLLGGTSIHHRVDPVSAYNATNPVNEPDLIHGVNWTPSLFTKVHPTQAVPALVKAQAGPR